MSDSPFTSLEERRGIETDLRRRVIIVKSINMMKLGQDLEMEYELWELGQLNAWFIIFTILLSWIMVATSHVADLMKWGKDLAIESNCKTASQKGFYYNNPYCLSDKIKLILFIIILIFSASGGLIGGILSDLFGRALVYRFMLPFYMASSIILIFTSNITNALLCRIVISFTTYGMTVAALVLLVEYSTRQTRTMFTVIFFAYRHLGFALMGLFMCFTSNWRVREAIWIGTTGVILIVTGFFIPESVRLLAAYNKKWKAWYHLRLLNKLGLRDDVKDDKYQSLWDNLSQNQQISMRIFKDWEFMKRLILCAVPPILVNETLIHCHDTDIYTNIGMEYFAFQIVKGAIGILSVFILLPIFMLFGSKLAVIFLHSTAGLLYLIAYCNLPRVAYQTLICLIIFAIACQSIAIWGVYILTLETFPTVCRGTMIGIIIFVHVFGQFIFGLIRHIDFCPNCLGLFSHKYGVCCLFNIFSALVITMLPPPLRRHYLTDTYEDAVYLREDCDQPVGCINLYQCFKFK